MIPNNTDLSVVQVNYAFDPRLADPDALLDTYRTLTGWSEALVAAGAAPVTVVQRFHRDAAVTRNGVSYLFCRTLRAVHDRTLRTRPEVVHVNGLRFAAESWLLRRQLRRRAALVVQDHADGAPARATRSLARQARLAVRRRAMRAADAFLFTTAAHATPWRELELITADQPVYEVLAGSTCLQPLARDVARSASGVTGDPALLWVGRLNANKDPLTVLAAFERCLSVHSGATLTLIFSEGESLPAVRARLAERRLLAGRVTVLQNVPYKRLAAYYSAADIFVLGSHQESCGFALIEACVCGAVPVVTDIPSFRHITANGRHGVLWAPGDAAACAGGFLQVTKGNLPALRQGVMEYAVRELSWRAVGSRAVSAYRDVVARRGATRA